MKLSILIVNYNSGDYLSNCVKSIYDNLTRNSEFEILVVDNNSRDESIELLKRKFSDIRIVRNNTNFGFAKGINIGIINTSGEYILVLNPDTKFLDKSISSMIDFMDKDQSIAICGPLLVSDNGASQSYPYRFTGIFHELKFLFGAYFLHSIFVEKFYKPTECDYIVGGCMLIRRSAIDDVGLFDENFFMFSEEEEFAFRSRQKKWKVFFYPETRLIHYGKGSSGELEDERIVNQRMSALYYYSRRYGVFPMVFLRFIALLNICIRLIIVSLRLMLFPDKVKYNLKVIKGNLKAMILVLRMKDSKKLQKETT